MRILINIAVAVGLCVLIDVITTAAAAPEGHVFGRRTLGLNDGWAAAEGGTTGAAAADAQQVYTVSTWQEFREALGGDAARGDITPRIVYVQGELNANTDEQGNLLRCGDYADPAYSLKAYLEAYDLARWGVEQEPHGLLAGQVSCYQLGCGTLVQRRLDSFEYSI